jgi:hypothetical protein
METTLQPLPITIPHRPIILSSLFWIKFTYFVNVVVSYYFFIIILNQIYIFCKCCWVLNSPPSSYYFFIIILNQFYIFCECCWVLLFFHHYFESNLHILWMLLSFELTTSLSRILFSTTTLLHQLCLYYVFISHVL